MPDTESNNTEEIFKNLRAIHLAIVAACFVMLVAMTIADKSVAARAATQLSKIKSAVADPAWSGALRIAALEALGHKQPMPESEFVEIAKLTSTTKIPTTISALSSEPKVYTVKLDGPKIGIHLLSGFGEEQNGICDGNALTTVSPSTLAQFVALWDAAAWITAVEIDPNQLTESAQLLAAQGNSKSQSDAEALDVALLTSVERMPWSISFQSEADGHAAIVDIDNEFRWCIVAHQSGVLRATGPAVVFSEPSDANWLDVSLLLSARTASFRGRPVLTTMMGGGADLPFALAFPDLNEVSVGTRELTWGNLDSAIKAEIARSGGEVEILGATLPSEAIATWGLAALLGGQLYFFIHLRDVRKRELELACTSVPWVAGYLNDSLARWVSLATLGALPIVTAVWSIRWSSGQVGLQIPDLHLSLLPAMIPGILMFAAISTTATATVRLLKGIWRDEAARLRQFGDPEM